MLKIGNKLLRCSFDPEGGVCVMSKELPDLNLNLQQLRMNHLSVKENTEQKDPVRRNKLELVNFFEQERIFEVKYTDKVIHNVDIHLELIGVIEIEDNVDRETIEELIQSDKAEDLALPLLNEASHIISFITSKTDFMPMIVPPIFGDFTDDDSTKETE